MHGGAYLFLVLSSNKAIAPPFLPHPLRLERGLGKKKKRGKAEIGRGGGGK